MTGRAGGVEEWAAAPDIFFCKAIRVVAYEVGKAHAEPAALA